MSCDIKIVDPTFSVILNIKNVEKLYVFIGKINKKNIREIINKIEKGHKISKSEYDIIKKEYNDYCLIWIDKLKEGIPIKFIYDKIYLNDTIKIIKEKIFVYLSNPSDKYFIFERNQQLWTKTKKYNILGYKYVNNINGKELKIDPVIYSQIKIDKEFVTKSGEKKNNYKYENEENYIIYDLINVKDVKEHILYVVNYDDIYKDIYKKIGDKVKTKSFKYGFVKKYWENGKIIENITDKYKLYNNAKKMIERNKDVNNLIDEVDIDYDCFTKCKINHCLMHINYNKPIENYDLLKIFSYLRKNLSDEIPFVKYKDVTWDKQYSSIYKKLFDEKEIPESKFIDWLYNIKVERSTGKYRIREVVKGLNIRVYNYSCNGEKFYMILNIYKTGKIDLIFNYKGEFDANINDIISGVEKIKKIIIDINKIDYSGYGSSKSKIEPPGLKIKDDVLILNDNTKISYIQTIAHFEKIGSININDLCNYSKMYNNIISSNINKYNKNILDMTYKKVSNYSNMNEIYSFINNQLIQGISENDIIINMIDNLNINKYDASLYYSKYEQIYTRKDVMFTKQAGISISININKNNIKIIGIPNYYQLTTVNRFTVAFLTIYNKINVYKKNKDFKKLLVNSTEYDKNEINMEENIENVEFNYDEIDMENIDDITINSDIDEYIQDLKKNINDNIKNDDINNDDKKFGEFSLDSPLDAKPDINLKRELERECDDIIEELDICRDLCQDKKYFLRRLQTFDSKLFTFSKIKGQSDKYSRDCQKDRHPVVMTTNPENHPLISRESYTFASKYGSDINHQNYYLCPRAWCPYHQIPLNYDQVKDIRKQKIRGDVCEVGTCPYGNHDVFIRDYKENINKKNGIYPGFQPPSKHPDGLCLPCCFFRDQRDIKSIFYKRFMGCIGEEIDDDEEKFNINYILNIKGITPKGRLGVPPPLINKLFNTSCESGTIKKECMARYGVGIRDNSFLTAISLIISDNENEISTIELKDHLMNSLNSKLFLTLNNGMLEILFSIGNKKTPLENFKEYLKICENANENILWDYLQRPGILYDEGTNIVILTENSILCPVGFNTKYFYKKNRKFIFLLKIKNIYEPLFLVDKNSLKRHFNIFDNNIRFIYDTIQKDCISYYGIDWDKILKDNNEKFGTLNYTNKKKEFSLDETLEILKEYKEYKNIIQVIDTYNKCVGIIFNNIFLPVYPSGQRKKFPTIEYKNIKKESYSKTINNLKMIETNTSINCLPISKIVNNGEIIAIVLNTDRIVPILKEKDKKDALIISNKKYVENADIYLHKNEILPDDRLINNGKIFFEYESYKRFEFEFSKYIKEKKIIDKIQNILDELDSMNNKRKKLELIIEKFIESNISTKKKEIIYSEYVTPNVRTICSANKTCEIDPHCIKLSNGKCKLYLNKINIVNGKNNLLVYKIMLSDDLLRNRLKRNEILNDNVITIIDNKKIVAYDNEILLTGSHDDVLLKIKELYLEEKKDYIKNIKVFDKLQPNLDNIDIDKYGDIDMFDIIGTEYPLKLLWEELLSDDFKYVKFNINPQIFQSIVVAFKNINPKESFTISDLTDSIIENFDNIDLLLSIASTLNINLDKSSDNIVIELYKMFDPHQFRGINSEKTLANLISSIDYKGTIIDLYIISYIYEINFIVLYEYAKKESEYRNYIITHSPKYEYILLYSSNKYDITEYNIIINKKEYYFKYNDLPTNFTKYIDNNNFSKNNPKKNKIESKSGNKQIKIKKK